MPNLLKFHDSVTQGTYAPRRRVTQPGRKARIEPVPGGFRVVIPGSLGWVLVVMHACILLAGSIFIKDDFSAFRQGHADWGRLLPAILFGVPHLIVSALLLWQLAGVEVISLDGVWMIQHLQLLGLSWSRRFLLQDVRNLIVFSVRGPYPGTDWRPDLLQTSVMFRYAGKPYRLGLGIDYNAAKRVVNFIRENYPMVCREA
jgi:hypothetical protein